MHTENDIKLRWMAPARDTFIENRIGAIDNQMKEMSGTHMQTTLQRVASQQIQSEVIITNNYYL